MPYHVFARAEGHFYPPGDCDLETEEEVLKNYCIPYLEGKPITLAGAKLTDKQIKALVIFLSDFSSYELVREASDNVQRMSRGKEYEAMRKNASAPDITSYIMGRARDIINGNIKTSVSQPSSIHISGSTLTNSPITGVMDHSTVTITVSKPEIEGWLQQIIAELEKNNIQNEEFKNAIDTLNAALQAPKPSGTIIKFAVEAVKSIGYNLIASAAWQYLMTHPPI
jgi:hypothetical protein